MHTKIDRKTVAEACVEYEERDEAASRRASVRGPSNSVCLCNIYKSENAGSVAEVRISGWGSCELPVRYYRNE